jgi:YD repeat-containing protein
MWDARGRLVQVSLPDSQIVTYQYDGLGRRISRSTTGNATQFLYDDQNVVVDRNGDGSETDYLNGPKIDHALRQLGSAGSLYFLHDHLGSTVALVDANGGIAGRMGYEPYGSLSANTLTRYLFTNREFDSATQSTS